MNVIAPTRAEVSFGERIAAAESRVYDVNPSTPIEPIELPAARIRPRVYLKREDQSRIGSYKWRGAYFKMFRCVESGNRGPFVTSSAGNHAQGVALAARHLGVKATIFMPVTTPDLKKLSVKRLGGSQVTVVFDGDRFEQTSRSAYDYSVDTGATLVPPFDDLDVIAGQATVATEIVNQLPDVDVVFVPIGGGGLASGISFFCKHHARDIRVVGVEVTGQDSMRNAIEAGHRTCLVRVDQFCDGTAVGQPGEWTFEFCRRYLDEIITVSNEQVCASIESLWEERRLITEPSGAIAFAGLLSVCESAPASIENQAWVAIVSGGNTDFRTLPSIVRRSQRNPPTRRYFRIEIPEQRGALIELLDRFLDDVSIVDFQYGKTDDENAFPVLGVRGKSEQLERLESQWQNLGMNAIDVSHEQSVLFRVIPFRSDLVARPLFLHIDFPERPGALRDLMRRVSEFTSICYFNYSESGQLEGHALIGFEFWEAQHSHRLTAAIREMGLPFREFRFQLHRP